jgi:hypothetical protein
MSWFCRFQINSWNFAVENVYWYMQSSAGGKFMQLLREGGATSAAQVKPVGKTTFSCRASNDGNPLVDGRWGRLEGR